MSTEELMDFLSTKLDTHHEEQKTQIGELRESIKEIDSALRGSYDKKGLISKVHNLESSESTRKKITLAAVTSAIGSAIAAAWAFATKP